MYNQVYILHTNGAISLDSPINDKILLIEV